MSCISTIGGTAVYICAWRLAGTARLAVVVGLGSMGPILVIIGRRLSLVDGSSVLCVCGRDW